MECHDARAGASLCSSRRSYRLAIPPARNVAASKAAWALAIRGYGSRYAKVHPVRVLGATVVRRYLFCPDKRRFAEPTCHCLLQLLCAGKIPIASTDAGLYQRHQRLIQSQQHKQYTTFIPL